MHALNQCSIFIMLNMNLLDKFINININMSIYKKFQPQAVLLAQSPYKRQLKEIAKLANYQPIPSIPSPAQDFNFTYAKDGHLVRKIKEKQQVDTSSVSGKFQSRGSLAHRLPRIDSKPNRYQNQPTNASQPNQHMTIDTRVQTEQFLFNNSNVRSNSPQSPINYKSEKKKKPRYKVRQLNTQSSDQNEQYENDATPGPGSYSSCDYSSFYTNNSKNGLTNFSFGSKASRFILQKQEQAKQIKKNPQTIQKQVSTKQVARRRKMIPFLSCSFKSDSLSKQKTPGPQDYYLRQGIQQQLIRKIQRNFKGNFGVNEERFKDPDNGSLGPGSYMYRSQFSKDYNLGSYYFLSQKKRFD